MKLQFAAIPLLLLLSAAPAAAQQQRDDLWVTNGEVRALEVFFNSLYIGGSFSRIAPATGTLAAVDRTTGVRTIGSLGIDGTINVLVPDGFGGFYIGGSFTKVLGRPRSNAAWVDAIGNLKPWNPQIDGAVKALVLIGDKVYLGGSFSSVGGIARARLAAVDAMTGGLEDWNPSADGDVFTMAHVNGVIYVGGDFVGVGGTTRFGIAALDPNTDAATAFNPNSNGPVYVLLSSYDPLALRTVVYAGGSFTSIGGQPRTNLATLEATPGSPTLGQALAFNPAPNGVVRALSLVGVAPPSLYVGGEFTTIAGEPRNRAASFNATTLNPWDPNADGTVHDLRVVGATTYLVGEFTNLGGLPRSYAGAVSSGGIGATTSWDPFLFSKGSALGSSGNNIWIGGSFASVGGLKRANLAEIDLTSGHATAWNPSPPGYVNAIVWSHSHVIFSTGASGLARAHVQTGAIDSWNPQVQGEVLALANWKDNTLFVGGNFGLVGLQPRSNLAAFDIFNTLSHPPTLDAFWAPVADDIVTSLAVDDGPADIYLGGRFTKINAHDTKSLGRVDFGGDDEGWTAPPGLPTVEGLALSDNGVFAALVDETAAARLAVQVNKADGTLMSTVYSTIGAAADALNVGPDGLLIGGAFSILSGQPRSSLGRVDPGSGTVGPWDPQVLRGDGTPGTIKVLLEHNGVVYVGGDFAYIQGKSRTGLAGLYQTTVAADPAPRSVGIALRAAPNPARGTQAFAFDLAASAAARVTIHNVAGGVVRVLHDGALPAGPHRLEWDGRTNSGLKAAPGLYFVRLDSGEMVATTKVLRID